MSILRSLLRMVTRTAEPPPAAKEVPPVAAPPDPTSVLAESLRQLRAAIDLEDRQLRSLSPTAQEVLSEVRKKQAFVKEHNLDWALCWLFNTIRHYPSWSQRSDATRWIRIPLADIRGEKAEGSEVIRFIFADMPMEVRFREWGRYGPDPGDKDFADIGLYDSQGVALLALTACRTLGDYPSDWRPSKVESFRSGEWALRLAHLYLSDEKRRDREFDQRVSGADRIDELRDAFGVDPTSAQTDVSRPVSDQ